jgi:alpha-beta hydrolase superfamily lysophospholipase/tetratricopeptide (TPR) repeat protein
MTICTRSVVQSSRPNKKTAGFSACLIAFSIASSALLPASVLAQESQILPASGPAISPVSTIITELPLTTQANDDFRHGRYSAARGACQNIIEATHASLDKLTPKVARLFLNRTACDINLGDHKRAQKTLITLEKYLRQGKSKEGLLADCVLLRAENYYKSGEIKAAGPLYSEVIELYTRAFGADSAPLATAYEGMAVCERRENHLSKAVAAQRQATHNDYVNLGLGSFRFCESLRFLVQLEYEAGNSAHGEVFQDLLVTSLRASMAEKLRYIYGLKAESGEISGADLVLVNARIDRVVTGTITPQEVQKRLADLTGISKSALEKSGGRAQVIDFDHWINTRRDSVVPPILLKINPLVPQIAAIYCIHGLGLHGANFDAFGQKMADLGYPVLMPDVRGFGSNTHAKGLDKLDLAISIGDTSKSLVSVKKMTPDLPVILLGESMGGALALQVAAANQDLMAALICSVPSGSRFGGFSDSMHVARGILEGKNQIDVGKMIVHKATTDKDSQEKWEADPQARLTLSPGELVRFQEFMDQNPKAAKQIDHLPVMFWLGAQDGLVKPKGTAAIFGDVTSNEKDLVVVGSSEHLIFEDENCPAWIPPVVADWLKDKLQTQKLYNPK